MRTIRLLSSPGLPLLLPLAVLAALPGCQQANSGALASSTTAASAATAMASDRGSGDGDGDGADPGLAMTTAELVHRGEYLVRITGCNDCHTPGYAEAGGEVDKSTWLVGSPLGYKGPWGTTYAANLRITLADMDEAKWLDFSGNLRTRPIMPDFAVRAMSPDDRRAIYHFIKSLGPGGQRAPAFLPPEQKPPLPYFELVLPAPAAAAADPAG